MDGSKLDLDGIYRLWIKEKQEGFNCVKDEYEKLIKMYGNDWRILIEVANRYAYNHKYEDAILIYKKAFEVAPKPRYTDMLASIRYLYKSLGKYAEAIETSNRELQLLKDEWNITKGELVEEIKREIVVLNSKLL